MIGIKRWAGRVTALTAVTAATTLAVGGVAFADIIQNDIDAVGDYTISAGGSTTIGYDIKVQGAGLDGQGGCNASDGSPAKVVLKVPAGVTATGLAADNSLTFTSCDKYQYVTFGAAAAGDYPITVDKVVDTGAGTYSTTPANFTLKVSAPTPTNTAPVVSVTGVTNGASYEKSSVPQPECSVTDAEDTNESATAQVSNGAYDALGSHTVTCSYTDGGGITRSATATYTVVRDKDTTAPMVGYTLNPAAPNGDNGWYTGNVSLDWTVTEGESPETLDTTGCVDQAITADQAATTYSCSATSEGGTDSQSVTLKRDGTAPAVSYDGVVSGDEGDNGWYKSDVTVKFTATDALSGPATASQNVTTSGDGAAVTVNSPAFSDEAGNTTAAGNKTSAAFKIDSQAPNAPTASLDPAPNGAGWNNTDVMVSFAANGDNGPSGVANCTADVPVNTEGKNQTVSGTCTDNAGNVSATKQVTVNLDKTAPAISNTVIVSGTAGDNGWYKSNVEVTFSATDALSGLADNTATVTSSGEGAAVQVASPAFTDRADNTTAAGEVTKSYKIDKTAPTTPTFNDGPGAGASYYFGSDPAAPTCSSSDATSGLASCVVTGGGSTVGSHTYTATATDNAGNQSTATRSYTVLAWTTKGFYSPVDMGGVWNTVKGGSTVPLKFELFAGPTELTNTSAVDSFTVKGVTCPNASASTDDIELVTTGGTSLRYDTTGGQFIQNWQTPKRAGSCYMVTMKADDGSTISANFILK